MTLRYAGAVAGIVLAALALAAPFRDRLGTSGVRGACLGGALAALVAVAGMAVLDRSIDAGPRRFMGALVGGILGRMAFFGAALLYVGLRAAAAFDVVALSVSLLSFFLLFQWLELWFVIRRVRRRRT